MGESAAHAGRRRSSCHPHMSHIGTVTSTRMGRCSYDRVASGAAQILYPALEPVEVVKLSPERE